MILGQVRGHVWATKKNPFLEGRKLLIVKPYFWYNPDHDCDHIVAVDQVGADVGQDVIVCAGLPCRWMLGDARYPVEASVMGIVDRCEIGAETAGDDALPFRFREGFVPETLVWK